MTFEDSLSNIRSVLETSNAFINPYIIQYEFGVGNRETLAEEERRYT